MIIKLIYVYINFHQRWMKIYISKTIYILPSKFLLQFYSLRLPRPRVVGPTSQPPRRSSAWMSSTAAWSREEDQHQFMNACSMMVTLRPKHGFPYLVESGPRWWWPAILCIFCFDLAYLGKKIILQSVFNLVQSYKTIFRGSTRFATEMSQKYLFL